MQVAWSRMAVLGVVAIVGACVQSVPTDFHTLRPTAPMAPPGGDSRALVLGLEPVSLPPALERREVLLTTGDNAVEVTATDAWIGPLDQMITLVVAEDLAAHLALDQVHLLPTRRPIDLDRVVEVDILALEATPGGRADLIAVWRIFDDRARLLGNGRITSTEAFEPDGSLTPAVAAMNRALGAMSAELAGAVEAS